MSRHKTFVAAVAALAGLSPVLGLCAAPMPSIEDVTRHNDLSKNNWVYVKTPSILSSGKSKPDPPDPRLAIAHYEELLALASDPEIRAEALRRAGDLRVQLADADGDTDQASLKIAIAHYTQLLGEQPDYSFNDRVLYQLARAEQALNDEPQAIAALQRLGRDYPASARVADAHFRAAELLFKNARFAEAEPEYRAIVEQQTHAPYFESAQYKLGWSLYRQEKYAEALPQFLALLDRELPAGALQDPKAALAGVDASKRERVDDALRVSGLSFAALGGGTAVNRYFADSGREPRFATLIYASLGDTLLARHRYGDSAGAYQAFTERHPQDALAPTFQAKAIDAYAQGGFDDLVISAKARYADDYSPGAAFWGVRAPDAGVLATVRRDLDDLGRHYQARAQARSDGDDAAKRADFLAAAAWYDRILARFPQDAQRPEVNLHLADSLYDGGALAQAAEQYDKTAYAYGNTPQAPEAAYALVQTLERLAQETVAADRAPALRTAVGASLKLADQFPQHPQRDLVLTRAAEDLYGLRDYPQALNVASRVLQAQPAASADLQAQALGVAADSHFAQNQFAQAETDYTDLLRRQPAAAQRPLVVDQLAASIYRQGESARDAGNLRLAAQAFQRVGVVTPDAKLRSNADYDAAAALVSLQDWPAAEGVLEHIRSGDQANPLLGDVDKKLALAYQKDGKPVAAADAYARIAQRSAEDLDTRRDSAWLAAQLYDDANAWTPAARAYESYVAAFPQPLERGLQARRRLADLAHEVQRDDATSARWLQALVTADVMAGAGSTDATHRMAAQASLDLGRRDAAAARALALTAPLDKSLARRKAAAETAIDSLSHAATYRYAEVETAAAYEIGAVYRDFAQAIVESQRPGNLKDEALEQYNLLLQEQASAFDDKSIAAHAGNLQSLRQGIWNDWIHRSADQLAQLAPAQYGKHEQHDERYGQFR